MRTLSYTPHYVYPPGTIDISLDFVCMSIKTLVSIDPNLGRPVPPLAPLSAHTDIAR